MPTRTFLIAFFISLPAAHAAPPPASTVSLQLAVFSSRQTFWPELAGKGPAGSKASKPKRAKEDAKTKPALHLGVLPIRITDYRETLPCDSCHRLSANGMEFFLENYLADRLQGRFPKLSVDLVAPHLALLQSGNIDLPAYEDSLQFPWDAWFDGYDQPLIYRPHDRMTSPATRSRLDRLGGQMGMTHLLIPARVHVLVTPEASNTHKGGLEWGFFLVFWNVGEGRPEWALAFSEKVPDMDLDQSLEASLDRALPAAWDRLPADLTALWKAEPR
jgi:hypothetical protein